MIIWGQNIIAYIGQGYPIIIHAKMWSPEPFFKFDLFLTSIDLNNL